MRDGSCPICGERFASAVFGGPMACVIEGGDRCVRRGFERLERLVKAKDAELAEKNARVLYLEGLINTPHTDEFFEAVRIEAAHQVERFGADDGDKSPTAWFWLLSWLAGKSLHAWKAEDTEKMKHHIISSAACLLNWFRHVVGDDGEMRPGIKEPTT
jgi:hypothetical protein